MLDKRSPTETRWWRKTDSNSRSLREGKGYEEPLHASIAGQQTGISCAISGSRRSTPARLGPRDCSSPFGMLWIDQALNRGAGRDFAFAVVRKR